MSKNTVKYTRLVNLRGCATAIRKIGDKVTVVLRSEPGCGKTSILTLIAKLNGDQWRKPGDYFPTDKFQYIYVDTPNLQYGDITSLIPVHATKTLEEYVGGLFCMDDPRPKVIMFDEVLKLNKVMKPLITRVMRERTVGNRPFPVGTIVFGTSNNAQDNIGDTTQAHEGNRFAFINMDKPNAQVWLPWAVENGLNDLLCAWVKMNPSVLHSYMSLSETELNANPFIFNPYKPQVTFVSPRSLEMTSHHLNHRTVLGEDTTMALVAGTIGEAAANSLETFIMMERDVPDAAVIKANPDDAPIPANDILRLITLFKSPANIQSQDDLTAYAKYVHRFGSVEMESVWAMTVIMDQRTARLTGRNEMLKQWRLKNNEYMI